MEFILEINTEISPCATSHSVGLNLCGTLLLFCLARVLNYSAVDIPINCISRCFKTSRGTELSPWLMQISAFQKGQGITTGNKSEDK